MFPNSRTHIVNAAAIPNVIIAYKLSAHDATVPKHPGKFIAKGNSTHVDLFKCKI